MTTSRHAPDHDSKAHIALWAILVALAIAGAVFWFSSDPEGNQGPSEAPLVEGPATIHDRIYWDTANGGRYFLRNAEGALCQVDETTWLATYLGESYTCVWSLEVHTPIGIGQD